MKKIISLLFIMTSLMVLNSCTYYQELIILNWQDYLSYDLVRAFEEKYNCVVTELTTTSNENMYNDILNRRVPYDIVFPSDYMVDKLVKNELIQEINDTLNVTFTCASEIEAIQDAFATNKDPIMYGDDSYEGYTVIDEFGYKVDKEEKVIYRVVLSKPEAEEPVAELTADQEYAINCAVMLMSDEQALNCISVFPTWESYKGKPLTKLNEQGKENRIEYQGELWKVRQDIPVVLENQPPSIETASLYERIDVEHEGTLEDPIPYDQTMTVFNGKYYIEDGIIYKCIRDSGQPLYATCASLVGNYFERVE